MPCHPLILYNSLYFGDDHGEGERIYKPYSHPEISRKYLLICFISYLLGTPTTFFFKIIHNQKSTHFCSSQTHKHTLTYIHTYIHTHIHTFPCHHSIQKQYIYVITMKFFTASVLVGLASLVATDNVSDVSDYFYGLDATDVAPYSCTSAS